MRAVRWLARWGLVCLIHMGLANCPVPGGFPCPAPADIPDTAPDTAPESAPLTADERRRWRALERRLRQMSSTSTEGRNP